MQLVDALQWNLAPITPSDVLCALVHVLRAEVVLTRNTLQFSNEALWKEVRAIAIRALYAYSLGMPRTIPSRHLCFHFLFSNTIVSTVLVLFFQYRYVARYGRYF